MRRGIGMPRHLFVSLVFGQRSGTTHGLLDGVADVSARS